MAGHPSDPFEVRLSSAAFLIVDMQNDFVRVGAPMEVPDTRATIEPSRRSTRLFRQAQRPVVYTRFVAGPKETLLWTWSPQDPRAPNAAGSGSAVLRGHPGRAGDHRGDRRARGRPGDYVVDKYWYGAFFRTHLHDILQGEGVDTVAMAGTVTQLCVEDTTRGAFHHGYKTVLLSDCVSSFAPDLHAATLKNHAMKFGMVMDSREFARRVGAADMPPGVERKASKEIDRD